LKIHELLTDASKWTQYTWARDASGASVLPTNPKAVRWSLAGAADCCYGHDYPLLHTINMLLGSSVGPCQNHEFWQDADGRTFEEVRALVLKLDI
jgi:hypothetical protein